MLEVSFIGMKKQTVQVDATRRKTVEITLVDDVKTLEDVVVTGYSKDVYKRQVHSLHIEISLNLSVFLRDSLSENTSFTSFTVTTVKDVPHLWIRHNNREQAHTSADCANRYSPAFLLHANVPNAFWP